MSFKSIHLFNIIPKIIAPINIPIIILIASPAYGIFLSETVVSFESPDSFFINSEPDSCSL